MPIAPDISRQLESTRVFIVNATDPEISSLLGALGVNVVSLSTGQGLWDTATESVSGQDIATGLQKEATDALDKQRKVAYVAYVDRRNIARAALKANPAGLTTLGIVGSAPRTVAGLLQAGRTFVKAVRENPHLADALATFGQNEATLAAFEAELTALAEAEAAQKRAIGATQQATRDQKAALAALKDWYSTVRRVSRVALKARPDLLEKLGITAR